MRRELSYTASNQKPQSEMSYTVEQLVAVNPYNPDILPDLKNYVNEQVSSQTTVRMQIFAFRVSTKLQPFVGTESFAAGFAN